MTSLYKGVLSGKPWQPLLQSIRYHRRVNVRRPRPPHYERAIVEALTKPIYAPPLEKLLPLSKKCKKTEEMEIKQFRFDNPYENILSNAYLDLFNKSSLIAICHKNSMSAEDRFHMYIRFKRDNMIMKEHGKHLAELALKGTKFEPVLQLLQTYHMTIFCPEPKVGALLKNIKKTPQLILIGGVIDGYFANVNQINEYVKLKDISHARAQLVSVLNSAAQNIVTGLNQHQTILVTGLDQYVGMKTQETNSNTEGKEQPESPSDPTSNSG